MGGVMSGEVETAPKEEEDPGGVKTYSLTSQERIIRGRMPTMEMINDRFTRQQSISWSAVLREKIEFITKTMRNIQRMTFSGLITDKSTRIEIVVTFLAMLELIKRYRISARQDVLFGDIEFERSEDWKEDEEIDIEFE